MKRPCRQTGNSVERGANYAPATLCDRVGGIAVPGSGTACFSGGCTPPHRDCERPNTAKAMSETRQKNIPYRSSFEALGATEGDTGCGACRRPNKNAPQPEQHRAGTGRNRNSPQPERHRAGTGRTETARSRNNPERERAETKTVRSRNNTERERAETETARGRNGIERERDEQKRPARHRRAADRRSAGMRRGFTAPRPAAAGCCRAPRANRPPALRAACP